MARALMPLFIATALGLRTPIYIVLISAPKLISASFRCAVTFTFELYNLCTFLILQVTFSMTAFCFIFA